MSSADAEQVQLIDDICTKVVNVIEESASIPLLAGTYWFLWDSLYVIKRHVNVKRTFTNCEKIMYRIKILSSSLTRLHTLQFILILLVIFVSNSAHADIKGLWTAHGNEIGHPDFLSLYIWEESGVNFAWNIYNGQDEKVVLLPQPDGSYKTGRGTEYRFKLLPDGHLKLSGLGYEAELINYNDQTWTAWPDEFFKPHTKFNWQDSVRKIKDDFETLMSTANMDRLTLISFKDDYWPKTHAYRQFLYAFPQAGGAFDVCYSDIFCEDFQAYSEQSLAKMEHDHPLFIDYRLRGYLSELISLRLAVMDHLKQVEIQASKVENQAWQATEEVYNWITRNGTELGFEDEFADASEKRRIESLVTDATCNWGGFIPVIGDAISLSCATKGTIEMVTGSSQTDPVGIIQQAKEKFEGALQVVSKKNVEDWKRISRYALSSKDAVYRLATLIYRGAYTPPSFNKYAYQNDVWKAMAPHALLLVSEVAPVFTYSSDNMNCSFTDDYYMISYHQDLRSVTRKNGKLRPSTMNAQNGRYLRINWQLRTGQIGQSRVLPKEALQSFTHLDFMEVMPWLARRVYVHPYHSFDVDIKNPQGINFGDKPHIEYTVQANYNKPSGLLKIGSDKSKVFLDPVTQDDDFGVWSGADISAAQGNIALGAIIKLCFPKRR